jgi:hypothetical protein
MALNPRIAPDGHLLAFQAIDRGLTQVAVMKPESGNWSILTHRRDLGIVWQISWSTDGARIYYDRQTDVLQESIAFRGWAATSACCWRVRDTRRPCRMAACS